MSIDRQGLAAWERMLADGTSPIGDRLQAYCIIFTFHRRNRDIGECLKLHRIYEGDFGSTFLYNHLYAIALKESGRKRDMPAAVTAARKALELAPDNVGALHNLASSLYCSQQSDDFKGQDCRKVLSEALDLVEDAICRENYAKFYMTKAQILSGFDLPDLAEDAIRQAIEREDSKKTDYHLRLSDYFSVRSQIELRRRMREATNYADSVIKTALEEGRRSNIEILSFFVAAVSFIIAGINITITYKPEETVGIFFVLGAALLLSVSGFTLFYSGKDAFRRFGLIAVVALLMTGLGLLVRWLWSLNAV